MGRKRKLLSDCDYQAQRQQRAKERYNIVSEEITIQRALKRKAIYAACKLRGIQSCSTPTDELLLPTIVHQSEAECSLKILQIAATSLRSEETQQKTAATDSGF